MLNGNLHTLLLQLTEVICLLNAWVAGNRQWKNITISKFSIELYYLVLLMPTIDLFGQVSKLQETLWNYIASGKTLLGQVIEVNDVEIPPIILGDGAFLLHSWMMKPYGDAVLTQEKVYFDFH